MIWAWRYLGHLAGALLLAVISEQVGIFLSSALRWLTDSSSSFALLQAQGFSAALVATSYYVLPFVLGTWIGLPVYRLISSLGWPQRAAWRPLIIGAVAFAAFTWCGFFAVAMWDVSRDSVSLVLLAALCTVGFVAQLVGQARARALADRQEREANLDAFT